MIDELAKQIIKDAALLGGIAIVPRWDKNECFIHVRMPDGPRDVGCLIQISNIRSGTTQEELFNDEAWDEWAEFFLQYARIPGLRLKNGDNSFMVNRNRGVDPELPPSYEPEMPHHVIQQDAPQPAVAAWNPAQEAQVRELRSQGRSMSGIARKLDLPFDRVMEILNRPRPPLA